MASRARGSSPAMTADSSLTVPLPDNAPVSASRLRPWLISVICAEVRPIGIFRPRYCNAAPSTPANSMRALSAMPFAFDRASDSWRWNIDNEEKGTRSTFARLGLTRAP